jgi:PAS domain-containing protein
MSAKWHSWDLPPHSGGEGYKAGTTDPPRAEPRPPPAPAPAATDLLDVFRRITGAMRRPSELTRLLQTLVEQGADLFRASGAALYTMEPGEDGIVRTRFGLGLLSDREGELLPVEGSFVGRAILSREPQNTADLTADRRTYRAKERGLAIGPALAIPLLTESERSAVILVVREPGGAPFTSMDLDIVGPAAEVFGVALENAFAFEQARGSLAELHAWRRETMLASWNDAYETACRVDGKVIFQFDVESGEFRWGGTLPAVLGYRPEEFGSSLGTWTLNLVEDDRERIREEFLRALKDGETLRVQCRALHRSGAQRQLVMRISLPLSPGESKLIGVVEDITERERLASHRDQKARAGAAAEIVRALRHEINNPLAVVIGQLQLLEKDPTVTASPGLQQALHAIREESVRMHELVPRLAALEQYPREPFVTRAGGVNIPGEGAVPQG